MKIEQGIVTSGKREKERGNFINLKIAKHPHGHLAQILNTEVLFLTKHFKEEEKILKL